MEELARGAVVVKIKDDLNKLTGKFDKLDRKAKQTEGTFKKLGAGVKKFFSGFAIGLASIAGVGYGFSKIIKEASDLQEATNRFNVVYRDIKKSAENTFKALRKEYKLSKADAREYLGSVGDILTGFGLTQTSALELADSVTRLGVDLSSFANIPVTQAVEAVTKAFTGEREALKTLGIVINEEMVKSREQIIQQELKDNKFKGTTEQLKRTARAYATMQLATEQSTSAMDDFNRSLDNSLPNQQKVFWAKFSDLVAELGGILLPMTIDAMKNINALFTDGAVSGFASIIKAIVTDISNFGSELSKAVVPLKEAFNPSGANATLSILSALWELLKGVTLVLVDVWVTVQSVLMNIYNFVFDNKLFSIFDTLGNGADSAGKRIEVFFKAVRVIFGAIVDLAKETGTAIQGYLNPMNWLKGTTPSFKEFTKNIKSVYTEAIKDLNDIGADVKNPDKKTNPKKSKLTSFKSSVPTIGASTSPTDTSSPLKTILDDFGKREPTNDIETLEKQLEIVNKIKAKGEDRGGILFGDESKIYENASNITANIQSRLDKLNMEKFKKGFTNAMDQMKKGVGLITEAIQTFFENQTIELNNYHRRQTELLQMQTEQENELAEFHRERDEEEFLRKYGMKEEEFLQMDANSQKEFQDKQSLENQEELINLKAVRSREVRDKQIAELDKKKAEKEKEIKSKQFETNKASGIISAIIDTAKAVMNALAGFPPPANFVMAGITGAMGAVQIGTIAAQKNPYAYAEGGIAMSDQFSRIGERGPEMVLPSYITEPLLKLAQTGNVDMAKGGSESYDNRQYNVQITAPNNFEQFQQEFINQTGESIKT